MDKRYFVCMSAIFCINCFYIKFFMMKYDHKAFDIDNFGITLWDLVICLFYQLHFHDIYRIVNRAVLEILCRNGTDKSCHTNKSTFHPHLNRETVSYKMYRYKI